MTDAAAGVPTGLASFEEAARRRPAAFLAVALTLAAALRFWSIGSEPLWIDEAWSVWFSDQSFAFLWGETPKFETFPPFYYSLLKLWRSLFGSTEAALRSLSAVASLGVVAAVWFGGRVIGGPERGPALGTIAALVAAFWRMQIDLSQDARSYALLALGAAVVTLGGLLVLARPEAAPRASRA